MSKPQPQEIYMLGDILNYIESNLEIDERTMKDFKDLMTIYDLTVYGLDFAWELTFDWDKDSFSKREWETFDEIISFLKEKNLYHITVLVNPL